MDKKILSRKEKIQLIRIIVALVAFAAVFTADKIVGLGSVFPGKAAWLFPFALYLIIYLAIGYDVLWRAVRNIAHGQVLDENFLMCFATIGAFSLAIFRGVTGQEIEGFDEACADKSGIIVAKPIGDRKAATVGTDSVAQIESHLHHGGSHHLATFGKTKQQELLRSRHAEKASRTDTHHEHCDTWIGGKEEYGKQANNHTELHSEDGASWRVAVGEFAPGDVAHTHASTSQHHKQGDF